MDRLEEKKRKLKFSLIPAHAKEEMARVLHFGASKHGTHSWRQYPIGEYIDAVERHLNALEKGEWLDPESGLSHIGHILASAAFIYDLERENPECFKEFINAKSPQPGETSRKEAKND